VLEPHVGVLRERRQLAPVVAERLERALLLVELQWVAPERHHLAPGEVLPQPTDAESRQPGSRGWVSCAGRASGGRRCTRDQLGGVEEDRARQMFEEAGGPAGAVETAKRQRRQPVTGDGRASRRQ